MFRKYDGRPHWHASLERLGEDEHGVWLGAPVGTAWQRGSEQSIESEQRSVILVPRDAWWVASFQDQPAEHDLFVDLATSPVWEGDEVTMIDLDLDIVRGRDGAVRLLDEDEFAEHKVAFGYPNDLVRAVTGTAAALVTTVTFAEPFMTAYVPWLARVS